MASQALYLKWRPQRFEDVVGQEHITQTLRNAIRSGRISHAYLFSGPRGTGKTTMVRLLAKAVNCLDPDVSNRPCNRCGICLSIGEGRLLDLIEIDAASHTGVDNVREAIRDKVGFRPNEARYKVYAIDEVHMLSTSAFNALLKTLEEPPEHVIFVLATTEPHKVLSTITSRCQQFDFHRISLPALVAHLRHIAEQEGIEIEDRALQFIARAATGSARDAISLLDQLSAYGGETVTLERLRAVLGLGDAELVHALVVHLIERDTAHGLDVINRVVEQGADMRQFTQQAMEYLRYLLLLSIGSDAPSLELDADTYASLKKLVGRASTHDLVRWIRLLNQAQLDLRGSEQSQLSLELAFVDAVLGGETTTVEGGAVPTEGLASTAVRTRQERMGTRETQQVAPRGPGSPVPPAAPPRAPARPEQGDTEAARAATSPEVPHAELAVAALSVEEVNNNWPRIRHLIREQSRPVEALVNSALGRSVDSSNRIVFEFASELLASKLEQEEYRRVVELALGSALGRPCRVRGHVHGAVPAPEAERRAVSPSGTGEGPSGPVPPREGGHPAPDAGEPVADDSPMTPGVAYREATSDPVVQDLVRRGGRITDVQTSSEE